MKLGANSVLFGGYDMETAFKYLAMGGYDGIELSAIDGMSSHLVLENWRDLVPEIKRLSQVYGLALLAIEQPSRDAVKMEQAMQAAAALGIPIVNCGPGGKSGDDASLQQSIDDLGSLCRLAEKYGVTLCVKAHVGQCVYNTPTTLQIMAAISSPAFGIDMDPSHIHRGREPSRGDRRRHRPRQARSHSRLQGTPARPRQAGRAGQRAWRHRPGRLRARSSRTRL